MSTLRIFELNARLHPLLVRNFLLTFLNREINTKHAQLIFTTHDTWQLSNQLLRRDEVKDFDEIIKEAESVGIRVGWSNPCFEIWMHSYYGAMPAIMESWVCCSEFEKVFQRKTGQKYLKADAGLYEKIFRTGDEEKALQIAKQKYEQCVREGKTIPSQMCPCTTVYQLVGEIRNKVNLVDKDKIQRYTGHKYGYWKRISGKTYSIPCSNTKYE